MDIPEKKLIELYERMVLIREFEERTGELHRENRLPGLVHLYVGEEAVAVGVCANLTESDYITSTHRGHGHVLEGGSMHIADLDIGMLGANGIVGGGPPIALGAAFASKYRKDGNVAVCFLGDGASNEGTVHEAANMASLYKVPLVFVVENNLYGEMTRQAEHQVIKDVVDRAPGYGMPGVIADGMDVVAVYEAAAEAVARARRGEGPTLLECKTYRYYEHSGVRLGMAGRPEEEEKLWRDRDPIPRMRKLLVSQGTLTEEEAEAVVTRTRAQMDEAVRFAEESPDPDPSALLEDVYTEATV
jgi:pyruvate dehydrogenase E1 component alpha subunit